MKSFSFDRISNFRFPIIEFRLHLRAKKTIIDAKRMNTFLLYAFFKRTKSNMEFVYENLYESNMDLYGKFQTFTLQFEVIHLLIALE